jgi:hypothetical protein
VQDDAASYSSLQGARPPDRSALSRSGCTSTRPAGTLLGINGDTHREYPVVDGATVHDPDDMNKIKRVIQAAKEDTEIFPHLNNYNPNTQSWDAGIGGVLDDPGKRAALRQQIVRFFTAFPSIAASRWTSRTCPTTPSPAT